MDGIRDGWKTSEFWLSLLAVIVAYLGTSEIWSEGSIGARGVAIVATVLATLGYTASRAMVKSSAIKKEGSK